MQRVLFLFLLVLPIKGNSFENYLSNVWSPIPPGCATVLPILNLNNLSGEETLVSGTIEVSTLGGGIHDMEITIKRKGCAVEGRSILRVEISVPEDANPSQACMYVPIFFARMADDTRRDFRLTDETNSWVDHDQLSVVCETSFKQFVLDSFTALDQAYEEDKVITVDEYNGAFILEIQDLLLGTYTANIPAYENNLGESYMAITGRLSGNWIVSGTSDQGLLISFGELVGVASNLVFLSIYTFDLNGNLFWMTGTALYELGDTSVTVSMELVENGAFFGSKAATRSNGGELTLVVRSCNDIEMTYDFSPVGLGSGTVSLVRIFSFETAGYTCADIATRILRSGDS